MANNSLMRKIDLHGNVDLTNFHADIHDYEGFEKDNSLFLNKRKVNWWKRDIGTGEIGGGIRGIVNGEYFDVYKEDSFVGKISRQYYKKESVSATAWQNETLQKVVNPYPENNNEIISIKGKIFEKKNTFFVEQCGDYIFTADCQTDGTYIVVYDSNMNVYDSFVIYGQINHVFSYAAFFYRDGGYNFSYTFTNTSWKHPTFSFSLPAGYVYINLQEGSGTYKEAFIYNIASRKLYFNSTTSYRWLTVSDNFVNFNPNHFVQTSGALGYRRVSIDYGYQYLYYDISIVNNNIYIMIYNWFSGYNVSELKLFFNSGNVSTTSPGQTKDPALLLRKNTYQDLKGQTKWTLTFFANQIDSIVSVETFTIPSGKYTQTVRNYSKKYGKWAVNYISNVADNIAHEYKKLFQLEAGENSEDSSGTVLDIDGYNDTYIYFHFGSDYYRISIQTAERFEDVVTTLNNVYFIFNTVSYLNAYYSAGNDWFCSCDDWNDRVLWYVDSDDWQEIQCTSRLGNNWQTLNDVVSVSEQIFPELQKIAVRPDTSTLTAYAPNSTWDGKSVVYSANGTVVNTDSWTYGHSLNGFYYALTYISVPSRIKPFYIDSSYTCPQYLDKDLVTRKQQYRIYFSEKPPYNNGETSLVSQGYLTVDGFTVQLNSGDMFTIPETTFEQQQTPALLDTVFLVYTTSVIINCPRGSYLGMTSNALGGWVLIYLNKTEVDPLKLGDAVFVINGVEYVYKAEANRINDYTGAWVCNTYLMKYIGYSTTCAYFYSEFDRAVYIFDGSNAMKKIVPLENYSPQFKVYNGIGQMDTLNITSIDVVIVNLDTAFLVLFDNQFIVVECGKINQWNIDEAKGTFVVNGIMYSLIKSKLAYGNYLENEITPIPIEIETQMYGDPENETNIINDCVYLTVDNLMSLPYGSVTVQAIALQNLKVLKAEEKRINLKKEDFNELSQCLIKYQPKLQECKGFKLKIKSDFEIADLKIGTLQGAINQTTKRI